MENHITRLPAAQTFSDSEVLWASPDAREEINRLFDEAYRSFSHKVVVLDDDPTGVQTVHNVAVVTNWEEETLLSEFDRSDPMFFVLTNSRSFSREKTEEVHRQIAENVRSAALKTGKDYLIVCRGDSTLRGHMPIEEQAMAAVLAKYGDASFDGEVLCPFFREGGRFTLNGVHYVQEGEWLTPAAQTEFAADKTFAYHHSELSAYIAEKCGIRPEEVLSVTLPELRNLQLDAIVQRILAAEGFRYITVDALEEADIKAFAIVLFRLMKLGRHYLIRSAAAVAKVLGNVPDRPLLTRGELATGDEHVGGLVIVGSHVKKTTAQLDCLRASDAPLTWIEFHVNAWAEEGGLAAETSRAIALAEDAMQAGRTAVVYTSRTLLAPEGATSEELLALSVRISDALTAVVSGLHFRPRFLIAKGGITSSDVGTKGLLVKRAMVAGQAQPGIPVWKTGNESRFPGLSYIIFPGNVGAVDTLLTIVDTLA